MTLFLRAQFATAQCGYGLRMSGLCRTTAIIVSIEAGRQWMFFSEPKPLEARRGFRDVSNGLTERLRERGRVDVSRQNLEALAEALAGIAEKQRDFSDRQRDAARRVMQPTGPLQRAAYYASVFLESQLFMVQERQPVA